MKNDQEKNKEEYDKFEAEAKAGIASNDRNIAWLKANVPPNKGSEQKHEYLFYFRKLMALEQKNNDLKDQLREGRFDRNWKEFISNFKNYMSALMMAFKGFVSKS